MRVLYITSYQRTGGWLTEALAAERGSEVLLEQSVGAAAGMERLRDESFDAVLVSHDPPELDALAEVLHVVHGKMDALLGDPDFNYVIRVAPKDERFGQAFHWYIKYMPRLAKQAGFELGTGMYVNTTLPEDNAKYLRKAKAPK